MHEGPGSAIERLLARSARALSGGALHPMEIVQRVETAATESVNDGVIGNRVTVTFHETDFGRYQPALRELRDVLHDLLDDLEARNGYRRIGERILSFRAGPDVGPGEVAIEMGFADTIHRDWGAATPHGPSTQTRRIRRHKGKALVLGDGTRVQLTHTPFTIGRGPGNDLVLLGMAVSRRHAQVESANARFLVRDLGSRNGLLVEGVRAEVATLSADRPVVIGDVPVWLEDAP